MVEMLVMGAIMSGWCASVGTRTRPLVLTVASENLEAR
jgi:hypothetical protein